MRPRPSVAACFIVVACNPPPPPIADPIVVPATSSAAKPPPVSPPAPASDPPAAPEQERPAAPANGAALKFERRCGWVDNPTPANWWITDKDGTWELSVQGGYHAEGDLPDFGTKWVETNGHHGYGCGCMDVRIDRVTTRVIEVRNVQILPIARCRADTKLLRR